MPDEKTVLFVCTGNTCRSPMAAALYNELARRDGLPACARSAGLAARPGEPAAANAVAAMREIGLDLSAHRARPLTRALLASARAAVGMTRAHCAALERLASPGCPVVSLDVPDPFGGGLVTYRACRDALAAAIRSRFFGGADQPAGAGEGAAPAQDGPAGAPGTPGFGPVAVVPLSRELVPGAARLERLCFAQPWSERALLDEVTNPAAYYRAALLDGRLAGYAGMRFAAGEGYLDNVAVAPGCRNRGVGTALLRDLVGFASRHGFAFVTLEVRPSNTAAVRLYQKLGFRPAGRRRDFYQDPREDALLLTLRLDAGG